MQDCFPCGIHPLDDQVVQHHFLLGPLNDVFFHRALGHQTVDVHLQSIHTEELHKNPIHV